MKAHTVEECAWFGFEGHVPESELRACGCDRCRRELEQREFLAELAYERLAEDE